MGKYRYNRYHDIEIDAGYLRLDSPADVETTIGDETAKWEHKSRHCRGVEAAVMWIKVPVRIIHILPWLLGQHGSPPSTKARPFAMHHATATHAMLVRGWRVDGKPNIPLYGSHYVRVECLVIEDTTGRVLLVKERIGVSAAEPKLVTGSVNAGEFISVAAAREVREETGVCARFVQLLGCGNRLHTRFDKDEMLVGALMAASPGQTPVADAQEVMGAEWCSASKAVEFCSPMAREWMSSAAHKSTMSWGDLPDFRGPPHKMEFHAPCLGL